MDQVGQIRSAHINRRDQREKDAAQTQHDKIKSEQEKNELQKRLDQQQMDEKNQHKNQKSIYLIDLLAAMAKKKTEAEEEPKENPNAAEGETNDKKAKKPEAKKKTKSQ